MEHPESATNDSDKLGGVPALHLGGAETGRAGLSRREFLKGAAMAGAALALPAAWPARLAGQSAAGSRIAIGMIGVGGQGSGHLQTLLGFDEVQVLAVCDVDRMRRAAAKAAVDGFYANRDCAAYNDFRELVARADIDAVFVCTPDNWHALAAIEAIRHGKDVYVEKPLTLTIHEGRALVTAARAHQRVVQCGTQQRSSKHFHDAAEFIRNDGLGRLERIEILIPANNKYCDATWQPEAVPDGLDWNLWLGPAPWRPFNRNGCHYNFRFILDYAAGQVTNWGAHYIDIAQWALGMDDSGPVEVEGHGEFPTTGLFSTATKVNFTCRYANGVPLHCHTRYDGVADGNVRFFGERGWLDVSRSGTTASEKSLLAEVAAHRGAVQLAVSRNHHDNFLQCIRTRAKPVADVEIGHRSTTVCNLGNIAMLLGRKLRWDPAREEFIGDELANRMRARSMRGPWALT
ncbi:MAG TPA: Gfo/Idh/MocA family oxidoreductase [Opitutus sp.]|nr:Gfo/Idh/MocA family oxidoreductase [Opitutus sp.]